MTGWQAAFRREPVSLAGDLAVVHPPRRGVPARMVLPSAFAAAWVADEPDSIRAMGRAPFLREGALPAILEYAHGRTAFCCRAPDGGLLFAFAGSPAAAAGSGPEALAALPPALGRCLSLEQARFRECLARDILARAATDAKKDGDAAQPSPAAAAALARIAASGPVVLARGDMGAYAVWAFANSDGGFSVAGVTAAPATLTLLFPFLPPGSEWAAEWLDDGLDYYVREGLAIRPAAVARETRAVVKARAGGGFLLKLCSRR